MSIQKKSLSKSSKPAASTEAKPLKASPFTAESMKKRKTVGFTAKTLKYNVKSQSSA